MKKGRLPTGGGPAGRRQGEYLGCAKYAARDGRHMGQGLQRAAQAGQRSGAAQLGVPVGVPGAEEGGDGDPDGIAAPGALAGQGGQSGTAVPVSAVTAAAAAAATAITMASTHGNSPKSDCGGREAPAQSILCACRWEVPVPFSCKKKEPKRTFTGARPRLTAGGGAQARPEVKRPQPD